MEHKGWQIIQDTVNGRVIAVHVKPEYDIKHHSLDSECDCKPKCEIYNGTPLFNHNSYAEMQWPEEKKVV